MKAPKNLHADPCSRSEGRGPGHGALTLALLALALAPAAYPGQDEPARPSLEELLRKARAERGTAQGALQKEVSAIIAELESITVRSRAAEVNKRREHLKAMGPEAVPLLVQFLDPGAAPTKGEQFRAGVVVELLQSTGSTSITRILLHQLQKGSLEGRGNVLQVLGTHPEPARIVADISTVYESSTGVLRLQALLTLARLGQPGVVELLGATLKDPDAELVDAAIRGLADVQAEAAAEGIRAFLASDDSRSHVPALVGFYFARPELARDKDHLESLLSRAADPMLESDAVALILALLGELDVQLKGAMKKAVEPLTEHANSSVRESVLVLLARSKDKGARRALIASYNDRVNEQKTYPGAYIERGHIFYRIGEYQSAIKDYKLAIKLQSGRPRSTSKAEPYLGIARCYARLKRYDDAEEYLSAAPVSMTTLRALAQDPAFALMVETKYRRAFHLRD